MKKNKYNLLSILTICLLLCRSISAFAQDNFGVKDIKGIWLSSLLYNELNGEYESIPSENIISFGFTEEKGKLNNVRYAGLYRKISDSRPKLLYYSLESNMVQFYDSSDKPLSYFLVIEKVIPKVSMTATLIHNEGTDTLSTEIEFLYFEKNN